MIREYAVEPAVLADWESFRYWVEKFGIDQGRLIARYPRKWKRLVWQECARCRELERKRIAVRLAKIDPKLIPARREYDGRMTWLDNAMCQQDRQPFHAVVAATDAAPHPTLLMAAEADERDPLMRVPREACMPRTAEALAASVAPLLACARRVRFVDPHFAPHRPRYLRPLRLFLRDAGSRRRRPPALEYHVSADLWQEPGALQFFVHQCRMSLRPLLPCGAAMDICLWREREGGESLHARYVLTDAGGVRIDHGLDEETAAATTDISLLETSVHAQRWRDFENPSPAYDSFARITVSA